ncbi:MAG TPA: tetratricopeptide repeat protein [Vicinamibacterales bacterium]|nr:tetratricopeptide repeat protein [Vicinamibacterales bacterium]
MLRVALALSLVLSSAHPVVAQTVAPPSLTPTADAYYEFLLSRRLEALGDSTKALEALKRAQALDPTSSDILSELAGFYARQNKGSEAVAAAEQALKLDPNNVDAHRMLGLVLSAWSEGAAPAVGGRSPEQLRDAAIEHLTKILGTAAVATDLNLQLTLARLQLRAGHAERAVPILENLVAQAPFATEPYTLLAEARVAAGQVDAAIEALTSAAGLNPRHFASLAELYERQGRWAEAVAAYQQALGNPRTVSRDLRLRYFAALLNVPGGQGAAKARDALKDFLMTSPDDARGLFLLANANLQLQDFAAAEDIARKLIALDPTSVPGLRILSGALVARKEYRKVVDVVSPFAKSVATWAKGRESDAALLLAQLAHAHTELGEHEQAITVLTAAVATDPMSAQALNSLGYTLAERGQRLPEAVRLIERALKVDPDNPSYLDSLGWALFKQGKADEAEPHLAKAAGAVPGQSVIQDHYGDVLARRGKYAEAIVAWERALAGDGDAIDRSGIERKIKDAKGRRQ